jgi:predicted TIM-barrel fold metal-dependent hydrolase
MHAASIPCCLGSVSWLARGMTMPLSADDDDEGAHVPRDLPPIIDAHVHVFPDKLFRAIWRWFHTYGWPVRYQLMADDVVRHLRSRGVAHLVLLHYAHKPGIARAMNGFVADLVARHDGVTGLATVFPGEPDAVDILEDAFAKGLKGVKLHCHVQAMAADDPRLWPVYEACTARDLPVVIHAGREPRPPPERGALPVDPHAICDVSRVERVLRAFPHLKMSVPHLGADEVDGYAALLSKHENLWLDTTMMLSGYFTTDDLMPYVRARPDRVMFGTDFPNLPYAWDREARAVAQAALPAADVERVLAGNARELFGI